MRTEFSEEQLRDPRIARANDILRKCVHCGFCTATCPSYQIVGDEADSPRGRIYLIKEMFEEGRAADARTAYHIDRCLTCLACMTTCPSGVDYMHLVDLARQQIEETWHRPWHDRLIRAVLAAVVPYPRRFRLALFGARVARPLARPFNALLGRTFGRRLAAMLAMAPARIEPPAPEEIPGIWPAAGERRARVALLTGCAQVALDSAINAATIRLLNRLGVEVVVPQGMGCCGALVHHMGRVHDAHAQAAANIRAWTREIEGEGLDAIVINTSGCGTTVKDYGDMFRDDPALAAAAAKVSALARDISEFLDGLDLAERLAEAGGQAPRLRVAYHAACSLQHGQRVTEAPKRLLRAAGFEVVEPKESHLCCGSAGTYNLLQPEIAEALKRRKVRNLMLTRPEAIAAGNIGCMVQIASGVPVPVVHTVELLDWATGGPVPAKLAERSPPGEVAAE